MSVVGDRIIRCPRCRVPAQQVWTDLSVTFPDQEVQDFFDEAPEDQPLRNSLGRMIPEPSTWRSAHCQGCNQKTLWRNGVNVYPVLSTAPTPHALMDSGAKSLYEEAGRVLPLSRRAGAALVRAALEKQVKILDADAPPGARLDDRIPRLSARVSTPLAELLDIARHVGNASLHGSEDELVYLYLEDSEEADDIAEMLFDAINDLVDELVARPAETKTLWDKLPSGVKASIERKRQVTTS